MDLEDLIRYENEGTGLDFKQVQYKKEMFEALLKDMSAFANAMVEGKRYIVVGVKAFPDGVRTFHPIPKDQFMDDSTYQALVRENIEPEITFKYYPYELGGQLLGVFEIGPCDDPPYMLRRNSGKLCKGDAWIRKGSQQDRLTRADLDRVLVRKAGRVGFTNKITVTFAASGEPKLTVSPANRASLPSILAEKKILAELEKRMRVREKRAQEGEKHGIAGLAAAALADIPLVPIDSIWGGKTYEQFTEDELNRALANVGKTYEEDDYYYMCEEQANKVQITILNEADRYLEDATIKVTVPREKGIYVPSRKPTKPEPRSIIPIPLKIDPEVAMYPTVEPDEAEFRISQHIGDIKHQIPIPAFDVPFRLLIGSQHHGRTLPLKWTLFAKNLRQPITGQLDLCVLGDGE